MNLDINNDPDLLQAYKELDEEFPGAKYDYSLRKFLRKKDKKHKIIKKIIFHGFFYSISVIGIYFLFRKYDISVFSSMIYGLIWFLVYSLFEPTPSCNIFDLEARIRKIRENTDLISRPYDKPTEDNNERQ